MYLQKRTFQIINLLQFSFPTKTLHILSLEIQSNTLNLENVSYFITSVDADRE